MSVEVRSPRGLATVAGGGEFVVGGVTLTSMIGRPSTATISTHLKHAASEGAISVTSADMVKQLAAWQSKMFQVRISPDTNIHLSDGNGGELNFKGFLSNPQYTLSAQSVSFPTGINHQATIISAYKSFIYDFSPKQDGDMQGYRGPFFDGITGDSFAELILNTLKALVAKGSSDSNAMGAIAKYSDGTRAIKAGIHGVNVSLLPFVESLLQNSFSTTQLTEVQARVIKQNKMYYDHLKSCIIARLLQENDDFWQTLNSLADAFQLMYIPSLGSDMGRFVKHGSMIDGFAPQLTAVLPVESMTISCGSIFGLPTSQCVVRTTIENSFRSGNTQSAQGAVVAAFPTTTAFLGGNTLMRSAPPWVPIIAIHPAYQKAADAEAQNGAKGRGLSLALYAADKIKLSAFVARASDDDTQAILQDWARNAYLGAALQASQLTAYIPMDLTLVPGFYEIVTKDGTKVGKGVLNQVSHNLNCENPQSPQASTQVSFTHIQTDGFTLPQ